MLEKLDALVRREQERFDRPIADHGDVHVVEDLGGSAGYVDVAEVDRVEGTRVDRQALACWHGASRSRRGLRFVQADACPALAARSKQQQGPHACWSRT